MLAFFSSCGVGEGGRIREGKLCILSHCFLALGEISVLKLKSWVRLVAVTFILLLLKIDL
jgi:hypothetical protein